VTVPMPPVLPANNFSWCDKKAWSHAILGSGFVGFMFLMTDIGSGALHDALGALILGGNYSAGMNWGRGLTRSAANVIGCYASMVIASRSASWFNNDDYESWAEMSVGSVDPCVLTFAYTLVDSGLIQTIFSEGARLQGGFANLDVDALKLFAAASALFLVSQVVQGSIHYCRESKRIKGYNRAQDSTRGLAGTHNWHKKHDNVKELTSIGIMLADWFIKRSFSGPNHQAADALAARMADTKTRRPSIARGPQTPKDTATADAATQAGGGATATATATASTQAGMTTPDRPTRGSVGGAGTGSTEGDSPGHSPTGLWETRAVIDAQRSPGPGNDYMTWGITSPGGRQAGAAVAASLAADGRQLFAVAAQPPGVVDDAAAVASALPSSPSSHR
jgi:hypothetical protein